jgi:hypothetical protein
MGSGAAIVLLLAVGLVAANLPWFSDRILFVLPSRDGRKRVVVRLGEWLLMYGVFLLAGFGLERAVDGAWHSQGWVFYTVTLCLFAVFAAPGVIWRKDLRPLLGRL